MSDVEIIIQQTYSFSAKICMNFIGSKNNTSFNWRFNIFLNWDDVRDPIGNELSASPQAKNALDC